MLQNLKNVRRDELEHLAHHTTSMLRKHVTHIISPEPSKPQSPSMQTMLENILKNSLENVDYDISRNTEHVSLQMEWPRFGRFVTLAKIKRFK